MSKKAKKTRFGRVCISHSYAVDLDNQKMVDEAKECLYEDLMNAVKYEELGSWIDVKEDKTVKKSEISDFLAEVVEYDWSMVDQIEGR